MSSGGHRHQLSQCTIIETRAGSNTAATETRRHYRLHSYTILKYKPAAAAAGTAGPATTTLSLAFPVDDDSKPTRSPEGELVFAYLPVTAAGFGFAIHADFELVASRQDVSDHHNGKQ